MGRTWQEICDDPVLAELPYKIESDEWGNVVMSPPAAADHCDYQSEIMVKLARMLPQGLARAEYPLQTDKGVKAIDVVWVSRDRHRQKPKNSIVHLLAPEICVEVFSPSNSVAEIDEKMRLCFQRGAQECWTCHGKGIITFFDPSGVIKRSKLCPKFPTRIDQI